MFNKIDTTIKRVRLWGFLSSKTGDDIPTFEPSSVAIKQQMKSKKMLRNAFPDNLCETINMQTQTHTASHFLADDNLNDDFDTYDWIIRPNKPQAFERFAVSLTTFELLKEQKYG